MQSIHTIESLAVPLRIGNLDTDQIMPKQFLRGIDKSGLAAGLLYDLRYDAQGQPRPECALNQPQYAGAGILLGGANFGCGSSREHAVWGLAQYGIRAIIAPSFAEIFYSNAMGNRLLLVTLAAPEVEALMAHAEKPDAGAIRIDVAGLQVHCPGLAPMGFTISRRHQEMFLKGMDVVGMSLSCQGEIAAFALAHWAAQPWLKDVTATLRA